MSQTVKFPHRVDDFAVMCINQVGTAVRVASEVTLDDAVMGNRPNVLQRIKVMIHAQPNTVSLVLAVAIADAGGATFAGITGLGHVLWIPLLVYVLIQIPQADGGFRNYLVVFSLSVAASLAFDAYDVWHYFKHRNQFVTNDG
jgi:hypothetical protein